LFICDIPLYACLLQETLILLINKASHKLTFTRRSLATEWRFNGKSLAFQKLTAES